MMVIRGPRTAYERRIRSTESVTEPLPQTCEDACYEKDYEPGLMVNYPVIDKRIECTRRATVAPLTLDAYPESAIVILPEISVTPTTLAEKEKGSMAGRRLWLETVYDLGSGFDKPCVNACHRNIDEFRACAVLTIAQLSGSEERAFGDALLLSCSIHNLAPVRIRMRCHKLKALSKTKDS